jgi:hypothetical protein
MLAGALSGVPVSTPHSGGDGRWDHGWEGDGWSSVGLGSVGVGLGSVGVGLGSVGVGLGSVWVGLGWVDEPPVPEVPPEFPPDVPPLVPVGEVPKALRLAAVPG